MKLFHAVILVLGLTAIGAVLFFSASTTDQQETVVPEDTQIVAEQPDQAVETQDVDTGEDVQVTEVSSDRVVEGEMRDMNMEGAIEDMGGERMPTDEGMAAMPEDENEEAVIPDAPVGPVFGMAMHGEPKYQKGDTLSYVNPSAPKGGEIKLHAIGTFDNVNPFILKGSPAAGSTMPYDTLLYSTEDEAFSEYGLLAESFEMPADRSSVTFNLRPEARFHDGTPVTAEDVVWTLNTLQNDGHPFYRAYYANVSEVTAENDHRVRFDFDVSGNRELPLIVGQMPILPKAYWEGKTFASTTLTPPMGSGPYKLDEVTPGRRVVYERVEDYWGKDLPMSKGRHNFDRIIYDYYRDDTVALQAFLAGEYDFRQENTAKLWKTSYNTNSVKSGDIVLKERPHMLPSGMQGFIFNTRNPVFQERAVRQAINYAFDFEWSNKQFAFDTYTRTDSFFENSELSSSGTPSGDELALLEPYRDQLPPELFTQEFSVPKTTGSGSDHRRNLRQGIEILNNAGWTLNENGLREKDGTVLNFEILLNNQAFERWASPFVQNLERMGIQSNIRVVDAAQYQNRMDGFDFDMTVGTFGQSNSPGNEQRDFWSSEKASEPGSRNLIGVNDPVVDALIDKIIQAPDREDLVTATQALDRVLLWNYYVVPHWHIDYFRLAYWDKFGYPSAVPPYGLAVVDTWWANADSDSDMNQDTE